MIRFGWPKTPKALLEARYKAFVDGDIDFILSSCHADVRKQQDREEITRWSREADWRGLEIEKEWEEEGAGYVQFSLQYLEGGEEVNHHEIAQFRKGEDERWYYYDSRRPSTTVQRESPKVGRNDPCPCGSGKKFKKCCGA